MRLVLFICTGNYYRSRFSEALFNHEAEARGLAWRAFSRGTAIWMAPPGLSPHTEEELRRRGIPLERTAPERQALAAEDLARADLRIAIKEAEHRPYIRQHHPEWDERVRYWTVHDLDVAGPAETLAILDGKVRAVLDEVAALG